MTNFEGLSQGLERLAERQLEIVADQLATLAPPQRRRLIEKLGERFCIHCGYDYVGKCYCRNDD